MKIKIIIASIIIIVLAVAYFFIFYEPQKTAADVRAINATVTAFGTKLQNVSLLVPKAVVAQSMEKNYSPYVSPQLLSSWENSPLTAPGRMTSSPWPARIEIVSTTAKGQGSYEVQGGIIEVTSTEMTQGGAAATDPVTMTVEKQNGRWLITKFKMTFNDTNKTVTYTCPEGKYITATFHLPSDRTVDLQLSDGRTMTLEHAIAASGARYTNADESFVFWNEGNNAFITENGQTTFNNCAINATSTTSQ